MKKKEEKLKEGKGLTPICTQVCRCWKGNGGVMKKDGGPALLTTISCKFVRVSLASFNLIQMVLPSG